MSASPPGNLAHLIVFVTCEGTGAQYITVKVGQASFACGDKIIDTTVTDESRTGAIRVLATGPAYIHWTLNGSAFAP